MFASGALQGTAEYLDNTTHVQNMYMLHMYMFCRRHNKKSNNFTVNFHDLIKYGCHEFGQNSTFAKFLGNVTNNLPIVLY